MMEEKKQFGDAAALIRDTVNPREIGDMPYIGLEHITEGSLQLSRFGSTKDVTSTKFKFSRGDILFGKLRPYFRKVVRAPFDGVCSTDIWVVHAKPGTDQGYLYYLMASLPFIDFATQGSEGTRMPRAKWEHVSRYEHVSLSLPEQRAIAQILGTLDDKIELNRKMNETLEAVAHAIFKSWFVDYDPVHAKAEGRDTGLPKEIADLFPDSFEDLELGEMPRGWKTSNIGAEFDLIMGQSPPGYTYNEIGDGVPFYQGKTDFGFRYPSKRVYCSAPKRLARAGDTLVSVRAPVGHVNMAQEKCCIGRGLASVRHDSGSRSYTYYTMCYLREVFEKFEAKGTVFGSMGKDEFRKINWVKSPPTIVDHFENFLSPIDSSIENNESQSRTLAAIRDALLPKLMSGQMGALREV